MIVAFKIKNIFFGYEQQNLKNTTLVLFAFQTKTPKRIENFEKKQKMFLLFLLSRTDIM